MAGRVTWIHWYMTLYVVVRAGKEGERGGGGVGAVVMIAPVLQSGEEKVKIERPGGLPVYSLSWNPSK